MGILLNYLIKLMCQIAVQKIYLIERGDFLGCSSSEVYGFAVVGVACEISYCGFVDY